jgi:hypothetical protein
MHLMRADFHGNTALHMCVMHTQTAMYDQLVSLGASEHLPNCRGMSPLLLAAEEGNSVMLEYIMRRSMQVAWAYGPVTSYLMCMREIDTVQVRACVLGIAAAPRARQLDHIIAHVS